MFQMRSVDGWTCAWSTGGRRLVDGLLTMGKKGDVSIDTYLLISTRTSTSTTSTSLQRSTFIPQSHLHKYASSTDSTVSFLSYLPKEPNIDSPLIPRLASSCRHKSYHPYLEKNKDRVRKDEERAAILEAEEEKELLDIVRGFISVFQGEATAKTWN
jgi:hypothetical protein